MNQEIKTKWVTALRSGDYRQGFNRLRAVDADGNECHCVIGVLCDVVFKEEGHEWADSSRTHPPGWVYHEAGMVNGAVLTLDGDHDDSLFYYNDLVGWDFDTLADYIERTG